MKLQAEISVFSDHVPMAVFEQLVALNPKGKQGAIFRCRLDEGDPLLQQIQRLLDSNGIRRRYGGLRESGQYMVRRLRQYSGADFECASYLEIFAAIKIGDEQIRDAQERLISQSCQVRSDLEFGCVFWRALIVSDAVRRMMEAARLAGLRFQELVLVPKTRSVSGSGTESLPTSVELESDPDAVAKRGRFWELRSSVTLPPLDPKRLLGYNGAPFDGDYTKVTGVADEYRPPELHYRQRDLKAIEPFDIALTFERFPYEHWPVVSHRFYEFCQANKLKCDWIPVRVDTD